MYNEVERGVCDVCGKEGDLVRTYFYYPINCTCCSPSHFELIRHHKGCIPKEPKYTKVEFRTEDLKECFKCFRLEEEFSRQIQVVHIQYA